MPFGGVLQNAILQDNCFTLVIKHFIHVGEK